MNKVTDPKKKVTDNHVLNQLIKQGIDPDYVEFWHDYAPHSRGKGYSPYAKFYRDLKSGKKIMVISQLPKVKPDGIKIEVGWTKQGDKYISRPNLFSAVAKDKQVDVVCLGDQPDGRKEGDWLQWEPQLFFDRVEQFSSGIKLLAIDPTNTELKLNTLEWDYGVCKRRLRIINGRIRERWVTYFRGVHEIRHNPKGNMPLRYGHATRADGFPLRTQVIGDSEILDTTALPDSAFPVVIGASPETFKPDAHVETSSVDGAAYCVLNEPNGETFHTNVIASGDVGRDTDAQFWVTYLGAGISADKWVIVVRGVFLFDTAALPDGATITGAVLSFYGTVKLDTAIAISPDVGIYSCAPASPTAIVAGDFDSFGTEVLANIITFASWNTAGYNDFTLIDVNSDDFETYNTSDTYINKTGVTKLGTRNANYDVADELDPNNHDPVWTSGETHRIECNYADNGSNEPKLVITYSTGWSGGDVNGVAISGVSKINGVALADITKVNGVA